MNSNTVGVALRLLGVGWYVAICIGGGALGGLWLDKVFDLQPILTLMGLCLGIVFAASGMYRLLMMIFSSASQHSDQGNG